MKKDIRILLVDDHQVVRDGLLHMLRQEEDMEVVGQTATAEEALHMVKRLSANTVLMDIKMPGVNGIDLTRQMKERYPFCDIIMLTLYDEYLSEAMQAGATGYLLKDIKRAELAQAIRRAHRGETVVSEGITLKPLVENEEASETEAQAGLIPEDPDSGTVQEVYLVIAPPDNIAQLMEFVNGVEDIFQSRMLQMTGSWDGDTTITIPCPKPIPLSNILERLREMPEVKSIEEKNGIGEAAPGFLKRVTSLLRHRTKVRKTVYVTLQNGNGRSRGQGHHYSHPLPQAHPSGQHREKVKGNARGKIRRGKTYKKEVASRPSQKSRRPA